MTLLVVEDDRDCRELVTRRLAMQGFQSVIAVASGVEALQHCANNIPRMVLMDIALPDVSGVEILRRLRANAATVDVPVIVMTVDDAVEPECMALGCGAFLTKPINFARLFEAMEELGVRPAGDAG